MALFILSRQCMSEFLQSVCERVIVYVNASAAHSGPTVGADILLTGCVHPIENKSANGY